MKQAPDNTARSFLREFFTTATANTGSHTLTVAVSNPACPETFLGQQRWFSSTALFAMHDALRPLHMLFSRKTLWFNLHQNFRYRLRLILHQNFKEFLESKWWEKKSPEAAVAITRHKANSSCNVHQIYKAKNVLWTNTRIFWQAKGTGHTIDGR